MSADWAPRRVRVLGMSGRLRHGQALRRIERELARSDPRLSALFLSIAGPGRGKAMPAVSIYRKLNASTRSQAVARAQELGLREV